MTLNVCKDTELGNKLKNRTMFHTTSVEINWNAS